MNEATYEARLNNEIKKLFPSLNELNITHQQQFQLRLGHNVYSYDGTQKDKAYARSDILIKYKEINLAMLELKAPGIDLTDDDMIQGVSYARLLDPMPPITIISNGTETLFYTTYDRQPWVACEIDEQMVQSLFNSAMKCASSDLDEAAKILLGCDKVIWDEILTRYTYKALEEKEGDIGDFSYQIAKDFRLERDVVKDLIKAVKIHPLVNFIGELLIGKTNAIFQLCKTRSRDLVPVYIDAAFSYDPFEMLANWFCREVFRSFSASEIKAWMIDEFRVVHTQKRVVFIFDNINSIDDKLFWNGVYQLFDINHDNTFSILLVMNEYIYESIGQINYGPAKNNIGTAPVVNISALSDKEFKNVLKYLAKNYNATFYNGAQCNVQYRKPRVLRILGSQLSILTNITNDNTDDKKIISFIPSCSNYLTLELLWTNFIADAVLRNDYRSFSEAMFEDMKKRKADPRLAILSATRGVISLKTAEQTLGVNRIDRMRKNGHVHLLSFGDGKAYLYPRIPEAISMAAAYVLSEKMIEIINESSIKAAYDYMMMNLDCVPYSDVAATRAIVNICIENAVLWDFLCLLINDQPSVAQNIKNGTYGLYFSDVGHIRLSGEMQGTIISNYNPWLLLSNLVTLPMADQHGSRKIQIEILRTVGSFNNILIRPEDRPIRSVMGYYTHEYEDGEIICGKTGIIEPITYAMQCSFTSMPEEMLQLSKEAVANDEFFLATRLNAAARTMSTVVEPLASQCAKEANKLLDNYIHDRMKDRHKKCK